MLSEAEFQKSLRSALNHLYNRDILRESLLIKNLGLEHRADAPLVLQRTLLEGIEALKPGNLEPITSEKRLVFEILNNRYVEQFTQDEVAHQLGMSIRQFRREQDTAIAALVYHIWQKFKLDRQPSDNSMEGTPQVLAGLDWIQSADMEWVTDPKLMIADLVRMIQPVADDYQVSIHNHIQEPLNELAVHPVAFRQIILNILRKAIDWARMGQVVLSASPGPGNLTMNISTQSNPAAEKSTLVGEEIDNLIEIATDLALASGGQLKIRQTLTGREVTLVLPVMNSIPVLVVDDNQEMIDLLSRFTLGSRFRVFGLQDPEQAIRQALAVDAKIVVLDVMMPKIDGWELLGRFRRHPDTMHLPVIILSILTQRELALSLGAKALVLKPVKQETFLSALDQIYAQAYSGFVGSR